mmetsp:Transcript_103608/g.259838  ORF Transcript_103608/g.259838 Transcript_103608/m.259838 type:complete len:235 (+) Transcript_103608:1525-2229(+)
MRHLTGSGGLSYRTRRKMALPRAAAWRSATSTCSRLLLELRGRWQETGAGRRRALLGARRSPDLQLSEMTALTHWTLPPYRRRHLRSHHRLRPLWRCWLPPHWYPRPCRCRLLRRTLPSLQRRTRSCLRCRLRLLPQRRRLLPSLCPPWPHCHCPIGSCAAWQQGRGHQHTHGLWHLGSRVWWCRDRACRSSSKPLPLPTPQLASTPPWAPLVVSPTWVADCLLTCCSHQDLEA